MVLLDIAFTGSDPKHGFLTGTKQTLLETFDGGKTWEPRYIESVDEEGINYRYNAVSFNGSEGWLVGKPGVLSYSLLLLVLGPLPANVEVTVSLVIVWVSAQVLQRVDCDGLDLS